MPPPSTRERRSTLRDAWEAFRRPVRPETRRRLAERWAALPERLRLSNQMIGRQAQGCGATVGVEPRCDFACTGCYLGAEADRTPALSLAQVTEQLAALREHLGPVGNVQLTDGEVTLRPEAELIEILRRARGLGLMPMLMTHGDAFRRRPGLLARLMGEGGLREVSLHVDTTQRGRTGAAYRDARCEEQLNPLREELAQLVRRVRRETRLPLRVATTVTVTADNLEGVPAILRCLARNADVYRIASFQPASQVGRTAAGLGGRVDVDELWRRIAEGLYGSGDAARRLKDGEVVFGHPGCSRVVMGVVLDDAGRRRYVTARPAGDAPHAHDFDDFLALFGGVNLRADDSRLVAGARVAGVLARAPLRFARRLPPYLWRWLARLDRERPLRLLARLATGRARLHGLAVVSHHFMDAHELASAEGVERDAQCVFRVPHEGRMISMCAANALGAREGLYREQRLRAGLEAARPPVHAAV